MHTRRTAREVTAIKHKLNILAAGADHQVGQTGKTVHPKIYVALGISGSLFKVTPPLIEVIKAAK